MRNNIFATLFFFFFLGTCLYYFSRNHPLEKFKTDIGRIFGYGKPTKKTNTDSEASDDDPARKKYPDDVATDHKKETKEVPKKEKEFSFEDIISKGKEILNQKNESANEAPVTIQDLDLYLPKSKKGEIVKHKALVLNYLEEFEQAEWVLHRVSAKAQFGNIKRNDNFRPDFEVSTGSAAPHDYARSGYDRGHLCPAGDFKYDADLQDETFFMSNMSPQAPDLNRKIWNDLEGTIRRWAVRRKALIIVTGPVLEKGLPTIGFNNKIAIPEQYYKIVFDPQANKAIAFLMKNEGSFDLIKSFAVSIDEIEKLTNIDFFSKLPQNVQKSIEQDVDIEEWF